MKKILLSIALIGSSLLIHGQQLALQSNAPGSPVTKWEKTTVHLGKVKQNQPAIAEFTFTNNGSGALVISEVKPSCSCTVPQYTKEPVGAGKKGTIKAAYNAKTLGAFHKSITVFSNSEAGAETLNFEGEVIE